MPRSGRRSQAASTWSRFIIGSPMPMNTQWSTSSMRRKCSAWSRISRAVRLRPNFIEPVAQKRARQRAARLRGQAQRAAPVAVAHEHGLDRPAVVRAEQRLDRAVAGVRLAGRASGSRTGPRRPGGRAARRAGRSSRRSPRRRARSTPTPGRRGSGARRGRRACRRGARGPRASRSGSFAAMRLAKHLAHAGVASRRGGRGDHRRGPRHGRRRDGHRPRARRDRRERRSRSTARPSAAPSRAWSTPLNKPPASSRPRTTPTAARRSSTSSRRGARLYPVGRLDADTTGLILLTNDGDLANHLMHPRYEVREDLPREGGASRRSPTRALRALREGVELDDGRDRAGRRAPARAATSLELTIHEGRKRQVRRMCEAVGHPVLALGGSRSARCASATSPGEAPAADAAEVERLRRRPPRARTLRQSR